MGDVEASSLPPDRGHIVTERRNDRSRDLDALDTEAAVALLVDDHRRVPEAVDGVRVGLARLIDDLVPRLRAGGRLLYVGAGTSGRLGVLDAAECRPTFQTEPGRVVGVIAGGDAALRRSSEGLEDVEDGAAATLAELAVTDRDLVIGIAAGGTTPYVLGAIKTARRRGAATALLTCAGTAAATVEVDHRIDLATGPELLTGSTRLKAGSATKLALNIITTVAFTRLGKVYSNLMVDVRATNTKLHDRALRILAALCPTLARAEAAALLERADGRLKVAIVMERLGVDADAAATLLAEHDGRLRPLLDDGSCSEDSQRRAAEGRGGSASP